MAKEEEEGEKKRFREKYRDQKGRKKISKEVRKRVTMRKDPNHWKGVMNVALIVQVDLPVWVEIIVSALFVSN